MPEELALIDDKDFHILFDLKFTENRLFCFEKQSYESDGEAEKAQENGAMKTNATRCILATLHQKCANQRFLARNFIIMMTRTAWWNFAMNFCKIC